MLKCLGCGGFIPEYSIEWSETHDEDKCRCQRPIFPEAPLFKWLRDLFTR